MCTSFAVYASRPLYGMNFDFEDILITFRLLDEGGMQVFCMCGDFRGHVAEVAGMNDLGLFAAAQMLAARFKIVPAGGDVLVPPYDVFTRALRGARRTVDVLGIIGERRLAFRSDRKGHQLYADTFGQTLIVEPGETGNVLSPSGAAFTVMTNFPNREAASKRLDELRGPGTARYRIAHEFIEQHFRGFDVEQGVEVLRRTAIPSGRFRTQCSMVFDPLRGEVTLAVGQDFERLWRVDMQSGRVEALTGAGRRAAYSLWDGGVSAAQLGRPA